MKLVELEAALNRQPVPVTHIKLTVDPAKLDPVAIRQQQACAGNITGRCVEKDAILAFDLVVLSGVRVLVPDAECQIMFILLIYVGLVRF